MAIGGEWIRARLTGKHGEKVKLAVAIGIDTQKLSKVLAGERRLTVVEAERAKAYFGDAPSPEEQALIDALRAVPKERLAEALRYLHFLATDKP